ncbi:signal peptidase I [Candidatus Enterococcus mansonii]|uniref:Signal peptidase I n=1 Tax=Candidatus Enterococcus mansonii TaxID=1834181 RepID=A0A242CDD5_9ENTE|nr:signal peptidase I [Enterococcus sp. 4G2_DIV0659]OTO07782.1 signal peptidase I [Enterococcus sp. 4G2_DIV0659]
MNHLERNQKKRRKNSKINQQKTHAVKKKRRQKLIVKKRRSLSRKHQVQRRLWQKKLAKLSSILETILFVLFILVCLNFLLNYRSHFVEGHSMEPTFKNGDHLLIHKRKTITRYDIVTFEPKEEPDSSYVKRVLGLPGDRIFLYDTQLYVFENLDRNQEPAKLIQENKLPDSTIVVKLFQKETVSLFKNVEQIPKDHYFVLGDNRSNSKDSRSIGFIDAKQIEGVVNFRFYPLDRFGFVH